MSSSRKREVELEPKPISEGERQQSAPETPMISNDDSAQAAMAEVDKADGVAIAADNYQERQAKFKALQARRVCFQAPSGAITHVLICHLGEVQSAQPQRSSRRSPETIHRPQPSILAQSQASYCIP